MEDVINWVVNADGTVVVLDTDPARGAIADAAIEERAPGSYRFDLTTRKLLADRGNAVSDRTAHGFVEESLATPEKLMTFAAAGHLPKRVLADLLVGPRRQAFLEACAAIEKKYTEECTAQNDPCLESGCAVAGEVCLQPVLRAELDYHRACAAEWIKVFASRGNRVEAWRD